MDQQTVAIRELLTEIVVPEQRDAINFIPDHITVLHGTKNKKQLSRKQKQQKSNKLTRREYTALGLNTLPTRSMKYEEALPLHKLWKGYLREHLNLNEDERIPAVYEASYESWSKLLVKTDLHGAKLKIIKSKCANMNGMVGICLLDTKNMLKIICKDNRIRSIPKESCVFGMKFENLEFTIFGKELALRPAERSVRKIKNFIEPFD